MGKRILKFMLTVSLSITMLTGQLSSVYASDIVYGQEAIRLIKERIREHFLGLDTIDDGAKVKTCYVSKADEYLALIQEDGSFDDVDYDSQENAANGAAWSPYLALDRMQAIAIAYSKEGNKLYQSKEAITKLDKAILYWGLENPRSKNWWENQVGVQLRFARIALFVGDEISKDTKDILLNKLLEKKPTKYGTGQNNLWFDQNYIYHALLTNDEKDLKDMVDNYLNYCLDIQLDDTTKEAVQVDNSFYMHGKQFYSNGYGMSMFRDMSFWAYMLRNTEFSVSQEVIDRMADYMLEGTRWTIRGDIQELYLGYRPYKFDSGYKNYAWEYIEPLKRMAAVDPKHSEDYLKVANNIQGDSKTSGRNGHYYMWRSGYDSHMRDGYGVNIKMDSTQLIGGEWRGSWPKGQDQGQLIYWTSSASSTIAVDGDEYTHVYPVYDWAHCPGTTTENRIVKDYSNYGRFTNGTDHMIGVSNGTYGNTSYIMDKKGTQAHKGYFFFDDEFVALGSGISSTTSSEIHTTLNQSEADGVKVDGQVVGKETIEKKYEDVKTIYNDKVGYVFVDETDVTISNRSQKDMPSLWAQQQKDAASDVFTAYINHGVKPQDASYAYIVVPNKTEEMVAEYSKNIPITIVANNEKVQAVRHDGLKQTQINFYQAGTLEYKPGVNITVDQPCNVIIDESKEIRKISIATRDDKPNQEINLSIYDGQSQTDTTFVSSGLPYAGQTKTLLAGENNKYTSSSAVEGHPVAYIADNNNQTYWQSQSSQNEWISLFIGNSAFVQQLVIDWGDAYAKEYDILTSRDGKTYTKISSHTSDGGKDIIPLNCMAEYVKIVMHNSNADSFQMKGVEVKDGQLLSLNKPVFTSSQSTQAPTFTGNLAVDGRLDTRWASKRESDDEWMTIDLKSISQVNSILINWEAACSDDYSIEVSNDNKEWKTVKSHLKTSEGRKDEIIFDESVEARYVKIHSIKSRMKKYGINIYEIQVFGEPGQIIEDTNIALGMETSASSYYTNKKGFVHQPYLAVDGSIEDKGDSYQSRWVSRRLKDDSSLDHKQHIQIDLKDYYKISKVVLDWESIAKEYKIQVSEDGKNWMDIKEIKNLTIQPQGNHTINEFVFDDQPIARYIKMQGIEPATVYGYSLWEFEVYGRGLKSDLLEVFNKYSEIDFAKYTPQSSYPLSKALEIAMKVYNNPEASIEDINNAIENIENCAGKLVERANVSELTQVIEKAQSVDVSLYTPQSYSTLKRVIEESIEIVNDSNVEQEKVDTQVEKLKEAIENLVLKANKTKLKEAIENAQKLLTDDSYKDSSLQELQKVINESMIIYNDENISQEAVDNQVIIIEKAIQQLEKELDKSELNRLIKEAEKIVNDDKYSKKVRDELKEILIRAKAVYDNENATQLDIDHIVIELQQKISSIEENIEIDVKPNEPKDDIQNPDSKESNQPVETVKTGDISYVLGYSLTCVFGLGLYVLIKKRYN